MNRTEGQCTDSFCNITRPLGDCEDQNVNLRGGESCKISEINRLLDFDTLILSQNSGRINQEITRMARLSSYKRRFYQESLILIDFRTFECVELGTLRRMVTEVERGLVAVLVDLLAAKMYINERMEDMNWFYIETVVILLYTEYTHSLGMLLRRNVILLYTESTHSLGMLLRRKYLSLLIFRKDYVHGKSLKWIPLRVTNQRNLNY